MSGDDDRYVTKAMFSGLSRDFQYWEAKYSARAAIKRFDDILDGSKTLRKKSVMDAEEDPAKKAEDEITKNMNLRAYNDLLLSMEQGVAFSIVRQCKSPEYPKGNAKLAFDKLKIKYEPKSVNCVAAARKEFHGRKLKKHEDPTEWIMELGKMRQRLEDLGTSLNDEDMMYHVVRNLPRKYFYEKKGFETKLKK